jgi:hypothetical protein
MAEEQKNIKTIRELDGFTEVNPVATGDNLIVSTTEGIPATKKASIKEVVDTYLNSSDGFTADNPMVTEDHLFISTSEDKPSTKKASIKEVVDLYLSSSASETESLPDTVADQDGNEVPNPLKGATTVTEMIDTDGDGDPDTAIEVVNTPITSKNVDTLVDPGSGLEVKTVCQNEFFNVVDCSDPLVKYKTKKLALATTSESKTINIKVNNTGEEYRSGIPLNANTVSVKFKRLRDAFSYIRNDIGAVDTIVNIDIENDIDEGDINHTNATYFSDPNAEANKCYIYINGNLSGRYTNRQQPPKIKFKTVNNPGTSNAYIPVWLNAININFTFIHLILDLDDNRGVHAGFRSHKLCSLNLVGCKFSVRGSCHKLLDASRGGVIEIQNLSDHDLDPLNKGFWAPAFEIDLGPRKTDATGGNRTAGDDFFCDYFFGADTGAVFRFPEYGPHIPWGGEPNTRFHSRIHFASNRLNCNSFFSVESNCVVDIVALFTMSTGLSFSSTDVPHFLRAAAFNSITLRDGSHIKGTVSGGWAELVNSFPGNVLANPTTQFGGASTAGQDYIMTNSISPDNNLLTTYKGDTNGNLTNYWDNVSWATI